MLTSQIIARYQNIKDTKEYSFDLKTELREITKTTTTESLSMNKARVKMQNGLTLSEQVENLREAILSNILLNSEFRPNTLAVENYDKFFEMLKSPTDKADDDLIAKLICALHISKTKFEEVDLFLLYVCSCSIVTQKIDSNMLNDMQTNVAVNVMDFFISFINNTKITEKIELLVSSLISNKPLLLHSKDVKLKLFTSSVPGLHGFSGDGVIYLNIAKIHCLYYTCLNFKRSSVDTATIIHLELLRIFCNELFHVLLRRSMDDMNQSASELLTQVKQTNAPGQTFQSQESDILIELELFGGKIDFFNTSKLPTFDGSYLSKLLNEVINGNRPNLDLTKLFIDSPSPYSYMDLDMDIPEVLDLL